MRSKTYEAVIREPGKSPVTNTYGEADLQALMAAISYLEARGREMTARDLAALLVKLGGPDMRHPRNRFYGWMKWIYGG